VFGDSGNASPRFTITSVNDGSWAEWRAFIRWSCTGVNYINYVNYTCAVVTREPDTDLWLPITDLDIVNIVRHASYDITSWIYSVKRVPIQGLCELFCLGNISFPRPWLEE
jgi:hypothetical protein